MFQYSLMLFALIGAAPDSPVAPALGIETGSRALLTLRSGTRQLSGNEIAALVTGNDIGLVVPPELRWLEPPERFSKDGKYIRFEHRDSYDGRYSIEENALCVMVDAEPRKCRLIFLDRNGRYWISPDGRVENFKQIGVVRLAPNGL